MLLEGLGAGIVVSQGVGIRIIVSSDDLTAVALGDVLLAIFGIFVFVGFILKKVNGEIFYGMLITAVLDI